MFSFPPHYLSACSYKLVPRSQWGARPPRATQRLATPVPMVFIHHTHTQSCDNVTRCDSVVKAIQTFHMDANGRCI